MNRKSDTLILATANSGKLKEIAAFFSGLAFTVNSLKDFPQIKSPDETGKTFRENALLKARTVHAATSGYVLADDSGLECDDLQGEPGVNSARFAGPDATDAENNAKLIEMMKLVHDPCRRARYVCALVWVDPAGRETVVEETCEGMIIFTPAGRGGFGYDPYFYLPEKKCTMAELPLEVKNQISHRGKALRKLLEILKKSYLVNTF